MVTFNARNRFKPLSTTPGTPARNRLGDRVLLGEGTVVSPGTQRRNFTYVGDIARGLLAVGEQGDGDEYGLGSHESYSVLDIANMFTDNITMLPERPGNRIDSKVDTTRAEREFGWKPEMSVRDYIASLKLQKK